MTTTSHATLRTGFFDGAERPSHRFLAPLRAALARRRSFRRTLTELRALSIRQRDDLGIAGLDMKEVAEAAYAH